MSGAPHLAVTAQGPADLRPITPDEVGAARGQFVEVVRDLKAREGHRAAVLAALSAIAGAADALVELGLGEAALNTLRMVATGLRKRKTGPGARAHRETIH